MLDAFKAGGDFHSRTAMNMYEHVRDAVDEKKVLLEWHPQPGQEKPPVPLLKVLDSVSLIFWAYFLIYVDSFELFKNTCHIFWFHFHAIRLLAVHWSNSYIILLATVGKFPTANFVLYIYMAYYVQLICHEGPD